MTSLTLPKKPRARSARDNHSLLQRASKAQVKDIIATRLLEARELNGITQTDAAQRLGYKTPAQLSLWEMKRRAVPQQMLVRASAVYRVSMDFLMGISAEPDRDPKSALQQQVMDGTRELVQESATALGDLILLQVATGGPTLEMAYSMVEEGQKLHAAVDRFITINKDTEAWQDMRGGAPLQGMADRFAANCLRPAQDLIDRHRRLSPESVARLKRRVTPRHPGISDLFAHLD